MSRERAVRRAARLVEAEKARARRARAVRRRALARRLNPLRPLRTLSTRLRRRRGGRLPSPMNRAQRAVIVVCVAGTLACVWLLVDALSTRIALTALIMLCTPALMVLTVDRRT